MTPDGKKEAPAKTPAQAPKTAPAAAPVAAPEAAKNPGVIARGKEADKAAQAATAPDASKAAEDPKVAETTFNNPENLPDNEWSRQYYELKDQVRDNAAMQGPFMDFALAALKLAAKYAKYTDMVPGAFSSRVAKSEELKDLKLDPKKADELVDAHVNKKGKSEEDAKKELDALKEKEKTGGPKLGIERAATKFVTNVLWNIDDFTDTGTLAANLLHTTKGGQALYKQMDGEKDDISKLSPSDVLRGTLIVFIPRFENGEKVVAYATGVEDEFKYYDLESPSDPIKTFRLRDSDSPLKSMKTKVQMVMLPNVEAYKAAKDEAPTEAAAETPAPAPAEAKAVNPEELGKKNLDKIDLDNQNLAKAIVDYQRKPNPSNLARLKDIAKRNFDAVEELKNDKDFKKAEEKSKTDDFNVVKLTASVDEAHKKVLADGSPANVKAYTDAVQKLEIAKKLQENFARIQKIKDAAKKNYDDAQKLK